MSARSRQRALADIAQRYDVTLGAYSGPREDIATDAGKGAFAAQYKTTVAVLHAADATVADVRRCARGAVRVFRSRRGLLPGDRAREFAAASSGVQRNRGVSVAVAAWERAQARRGWSS